MWHGVTAAELKGAPVGWCLDLDEADVIRAEEEVPAMFSASPRFPTLLSPAPGSHQCARRGEEPKGVARQSPQPLSPIEPSQICILRWKVA